MENQPWKQRKQAYQDALNYMKGRQQGVITSVRTPWSKMNAATTDGFEWHSMIVIGGRPGAGKTLIKDQFIREAFVLNPASNMRVLEFSLEMVGRVSAMRSMTNHLGMSYNRLCSVGDKITDEDLKKAYAFSQEQVKRPIDIVEELETVEEFEKIIKLYMEHNSTKVQVKDETGKISFQTQYTKTIVTLDHSLLINEKNKSDMLYNLGATITRLKRRYPIIFIILSQLNRNIDHPDRNEDGKYGNYILESDIFGADALLQHADFVLGLNRPGKAKIRFYGPERYIIDSETLLVMHFLKARNGTTGLAFFNTFFEEGYIQEMEQPPPTGNNRSSRF